MSIATKHNTERTECKGGDSSWLGQFKPSRVINTNITGAYLAQEFHRNLQQLHAYAET